MTKPLASSPVLIGRARELALIAHAQAAARAGQGACVAVTGEAGIGKSRLLSEARQAAQSEGFFILEGHCFEPDEAFPYAPLIDALRLYCLNRKPNEIRAVFGALAPELVKLLPELALAVDGLEPSPALEPEAEKRRLFETLAHFLTGLASRQPLLFIIEDLHWSDETSLDFLFYLARRLATWPILVLVSYRREEAPERLTKVLAQLDRGRLLQEIGLGRFERREVEALLQAMFDQPKVMRSDFIEMILPLAEGNPFFVEEILKSLVTAGGIFWANGHWERRPLVELDIPRTVQQAVQGRLAILSANAHRTLVLAAVAGRRFDFSLLGVLTTMDDSTLLETIKELVKAQLVDEESAEVFAFHHALTREAVYGTLLHRERKALHHKVAEAIEAQMGDRLESQVGDLSYHYFAAGAWEKALAYAIRAGERARALNAPREAIEHFTRALEAGRQLGQAPSGKIVRARGQAYETVGDFERARVDYETGFNTAQVTHDRQAEWQALIDLGFLWAARDYEKSKTYCQQALDLAREIGEAGLIGKSLNRLGNCYLNANQTTTARRYHEEALDVFEELNDRLGLAQTLDLLGVVCSFEGAAKEATAYMRRAVGLFEELGDKQGQASSLTLLNEYGPIAIDLDLGTVQLTFAEALGCAETAIRLARETGWRSGEAFALLHRGMTLVSQGEYRPALEAMTLGLKIAEDIAHDQWQTSGHLMMGSIYLDLFDFEQAQQHLKRALTMAREVNSTHWTLNSLALMALMHLSQNELEQARADLSEIARVDTGEATFLKWSIKRAQAALAFAEGQPEAALAIIADVTKTNETAGEALVLPNLWKLQGEVLTGLGEWAAAEAVLKKACQIAVEHGSRPLLWRLHMSLGGLYKAQGRKQEAESEFELARHLIETLAVNIPEPRLQANFLSRALAQLPGTGTLSARKAAKKEFGGLTERERMVATLVAQGKSNKEIAEALVVGERTVETHVGNILSKLGFTARTQIAVWAVEKGLGPEL